MKIIVIDLDKAKLTDRQKKRLFENKICQLTRNDFGKKTLVHCPKVDKKYLDFKNKFEDSVFRLKDDREDTYLKLENNFFWKVRRYVQWARIGIVIRRDKAVKILLALLG